MITLEEDQENMKSWVQTFDPKDRLIAAIIFEEKPTLLIRPEYDQDYKVNQTADGETRFIITTEEFHNDFWVECDLTIMQAIDFCFMFGSEFRIQV